jgi:hypothetical protein
MIINGVIYNDHMSEADVARNEELCNSVSSTNDYTLNVKNKIWIKYNGTEIHISKMHNDHIINCLNMLERNGDKDSVWINIFLNELSDRNVTCKATSKTIVIYEMI